MASQKGNLNLVKFCVERGAVVNFKNSMQRTPLDYAKNKEIKEFLQSKGGKPSSFLDKAIGTGKWLIKILIIFVITLLFIAVMSSIFDWVLSLFT